MLIVDFSLRGNLPFFEDTFTHVPDATCSFEDVHLVTNATGATSYVFFTWVTDTTVDAFEHALAADPTIEDYKVLVPNDEKAFFRVETTPKDHDHPLIFRFFCDHNITPLEITRDATGFHGKARFPDKETISTLNKVAIKVADIFELHRVLSSSSVPEDLFDDGIPITHDQHEALSVAYQHGYFDVPRQITVDELGDHLGISGQATSQRLRRGLQTVVQTTIKPDTAPGNGSRRSRSA